MRTNGNTYYDPAYLKVGHTCRHCNTDILAPATAADEEIACSDPSCKVIGCDRCLERCAFCEGRMCDRHVAQSNQYVICHVCAVEHVLDAISTRALAVKLEGVR